jgi:hypothetical protein
MSTRRLLRLDSRAGVGSEGIEAVAKLGDFAPILVPGQPWQKVRRSAIGFGTSTTL